jgi:hypothetical protein
MDGPMAARTSKSTFLHDEVRMTLQAGRYVPGERIDPAALAQEFKTSPTPVRFALYRLVGEGMIADHAREGFHVPLVTEVALRDLYDWMQRLLIMACDIGPASTQVKGRAFDIPKYDGDIVLLTRELFETIAFATDHHCLYSAVRQANDRLSPVRRIKHRLSPNTSTELAHLARLWHKQDLDALKTALTEYHECRKRLVPRIVAIMARSIPDVPD